MSYVTWVCRGVHYMPSILALNQWYWHQMLSVDVTGCERTDNARARTDHQFPHQITCL
jgi:hypothetical protein